MRSNRERMAYGTTNRKKRKAQDTWGTRISNRREAREHVGYKAHETREDVANEVRKEREHVGHEALQAWGHT